MTGMKDPSSKEVFTPPFNRPWPIEYSKPVSEYFCLRLIFLGSIVSFLETLLTYPTEYVKTQLQLDEKGEKKLYKGIVDCAKKTVNQYGVSGLYRGLPILLCGSIPKSTIRFGSFELYEKQFLRRTGNYKLNPAQSFLCGFAAGVTEALLIVTPVETLKVRFIDDQRSGKLNYKGLIHGLGVIFKEQGVSGMYKGVAPTVIRQSSGLAIRFWVMDLCKNWYRKYDVHKPVPIYVIGVFGGLAGFVSVVINNPVDVVATRMQSINAVKYKSMLDCFIRTMINEGPLSFYKGTVPRSIRAVINVSITFMSYDGIMQKLGEFLQNTSRKPKQL